MHACTGEGNGNPLQYSCLENLRDRGAWWAAVYGVAESWPLASRVAQGVSGPSSSCVWNPRVFADDARVGTSMFSSSETGVSGKFGGRIKGAKYRFALQYGLGASLDML